MHIYIEFTPARKSLGRTHGAPYRGYGYVPLRFGGGGGGASLGEWEHNNNKPENHCYLVEEAEVRTRVPFIFNLFFF